MFILFLNWPSDGFIIIISFSGIRSMRLRTLIEHPHNSLSAETIMNVGSELRPDNI